MNVRRMLYNLILCATIAISHNIFGMEKPSSPNTIDGIIDDIARNLLSGEYTFSSQVPEALLVMFNNAIEGKVRTRLKDDIFKNPTPYKPKYLGDSAQQHMLSADERLKHLETLQAKANTLYMEGKLTSCWLNFIALNIASLLSESFACGKTGLGRDLDASTIEECFERFAYIHDHRSEYRPIAFKVVYPDLALSTTNIYENPNSVSFGSFCLKQTDLVTLYRWVLLNDCFFVPIFMNRPYFKIATFNKAIAHRIALIAIPLRNADFDTSVDQSPLIFAQHELFHASIFENLTFCLNVLSVETNPLHKLMYETWFKIKSSQQGMFAYFTIFHENGPLIRMNVVDKKGSITLEEAVEHVKQRHGEEYNHDFSSPESYVRSILRSRGHENADLTHCNDLDKNTCYRFPNLELGNNSLKNVYSINSLSAMKRNLGAFLVYLQRIGASIGPDDQDDPDFGINFYAYLENSLHYILDIMDEK